MDGKKDMKILIFSSEQDSTRILKCLAASNTRACIMGINESHSHIRFSKYCLDYFRYELSDLKNDKEGDNIVSRINNLAPSLISYLCKLSDTYIMAFGGFNKLRS